ncbi:ABC transporter substrate-binding protein [Candidatus Bipolaricaulota bacterium]|nr:ABC transporter substrate-binding protein [Candidatus Bipolaricaulota bacterium]
MVRKSTVLLIVLSLLVTGLGVVGLSSSHAMDEPLVVPIGEKDDTWGMGPLSPGKRGGSVTLASISLPKTFNHAVAQETSSTDVTDLIMGAGLTDTSPATGKTVPAIARDWEISEDRKTYTFHIRKGVKFNDGKSLTAEDVIFTFKKIIFNEKVSADARSILKVEGKLPSIKKVDEYTVQFTTPTVFGPFVRQIGYTPIYPKHAFEDFSGEEFNSAWGKQVASNNPEKIIGAGPFKIKKFAPAQQVVLERNPYYYKRDPEGTQLPYIDELIFLKVENTDVQMLKFKNHELDVHGARAEDIPFLLRNEEDEGWNVKINQKPETGAPAGTDFIAFNWDVDNKELAEVFRKKDFRRAMSHAVNREDIINNIYNGLAIRQVSPISQLSPYYNPEAEEKYPGKFDLEKARKMLDELGLKDTDDDGVRELPNGKDLEFELITNKGATRRVDVGNIVASDFEKIGVKATLNPISFNPMVQKLLGGKYEAVIVGLIGDPIEPNSGKNVWDSDGSLHLWHLKASDNPVEWEKRVTELFNKGLKHVGYENRKKFYDEFQTIVSEQVPVIYTAGEVYLYAHEEKLVNTETYSPLGSTLGHAEYIWWNK